MDGGADTDENLVTLCQSCHREWELVEMHMKLDFWKQWLPLPPCELLIAAFITGHAWTEQTSGKAIYDGVMQTHRLLKELHASELTDAPDEGEE